MASAAAAKKCRRLAHPGRRRGSASAADEPQVRLVDQGGGVQRLARLLLGELLRRELAELVVDQRQQLAGRAGLPAVERVEGPADLMHRVATPIRSHGPVRDPRRAWRVAGTSLLPRAVPEVPPCNTLHSPGPCGNRSRATSPRPPPTPAAVARPGGVPPGP